MRTRKLYLFCFMFMIAAALSAQSPTIHFLFFFDTSDLSVGGSAKITQDRMLELADIIAKNAGANKNVIVVRGEELAVKKADDVIQKLVVGEKDVILFYFVGHGWNNFQSYYPMLKMGGEGMTPENSRGLEDIYNQLLGKKARSTLVFAEACNTSRSVKPQKVNEGEESHSRFNVNPNHIRTLFRQIKVNIIMTSSQRGQESKSDDFGGYFSNSFRSAFDRVTSKEYQEDVSWDNIIAETMEGTHEVSKYKQNPVYAIDYYETNNPNAANNGSKEKCPMNMAAFYKVSDDYVFLRKYWSDILNYEKDYATETYETFYQIEVQEFYDNLLVKLNLNNHVSDMERKWFSDTAREINTYLKTINKYKAEDGFKTKAFSKLSIPIDNLKQIQGKLDEFRKRCKE